MRDVRKNAIIKTCIEQDLREERPEVRLHRSVPSNGQGRVPKLNVRDGAHLAIGEDATTPVNPEPLHLWQQRCDAPNAIMKSLRIPRPASAAGLRLRLSVYDAERVIN